MPASSPRQKPDCPGPPPPPSTWRPLVARALEEDLGAGDLTSAVSLDPGVTGTARLEARAPLILCGQAVVAEVFAQVDPEIEVEALAADGDRLEAGRVFARVHGPVASILTAERTALNFLGRLCGIATLTRSTVDLVDDLGTHICDTRKTLPGWRVLDKYAVRCGGGVNHRFGLYDGILLKDNHLAAGGGLGPAIRRALAQAPAGIRIQVEVESLADAVAAADAGIDFLLLDNQSPEQVREIVEAIGDRVLLEASGGIHAGNLRSYAETGVARISLGALTHSAVAVDVALEMETEVDDGADGG